MPNNTITAFNPGGPSAGQPLDVVPSGSGSRPSTSTPEGAPPGRVSSGRTAPRGAVLPGPQRIELDSTAAISVSVPMQFDTLAAVPMTLTVPRGLLDHPESNTSGLSGDLLRQRVEQLLSSLPPGCAKWCGDEGGEIVASIGLQNLRAEFDSQRQLKYLSLGSEGQPSTLRLSEQGWLRGAIGAKGVSVPADAPAWKLPGSGQPVFCDGDIPRRENDFPDSLGREADLRELALEALAQGTAGNHVQRDDGSASFDMPFRGHTLNVTYEHENQEVQSLRVSQGTQSLGRWSHTDALDDELLRETESRPSKRLKTVPDDMTNWDADLTRVNDHPTKVTTIDIDFDDDAQVNDLLDDILGTSTGTGESARPMDIDTPAGDSSTQLRKNKGKAAVRPGDDDPVDIEPASTGQTASLPAPQYTMPPVLLSYRAREQAAADADLKALANALKDLFASERSAEPSGGGSQGAGRGGATTSPLKLPAHLRKFLEQALEGDGTTLPGVNPRVRLYEKTFAAPYANLPSNVRSMPCVSAATGGTTVKLLALRGAEPGQFAKVMVYSPENQATLEGMAQSGEHVDSQPLPQPGAIRDALEGLFEGDANAPQLRVLALLQTPAYGLGSGAIKALRVEDTADGKRIGGVQISGQDEPDNADTDWSRIVKPWLEQRSTSGDRLLSIAYPNIPASIKTLAAQLPGLGLLCARGTPQGLLQRAAAATLEAAGVPVKLMHDQSSKVELLKLRHVADDGNCPPAKLSEAGKSILRAYVQLRMRDLQSGEVPGEQPLFGFQSLQLVESAITAHWRAKASDEASRADVTPPEPRLPAAGEVNALIGSGLNDCPNPAVARACARLMLPPYCLSSTEIQALNIHDGEIVEPASDGGWQALDIPGRQDAAGTGSDNDWARIFKPMLDVLSNNGTEPIPNGLFLRGRGSRGKLVKLQNNFAQMAIGTLARAQPELGFLSGGITTAGAMQACAAAVLREAGAPDNLLKYDGLRLGDVGNDGAIAQVPNLSDAGKSTVLAWKRLRERTLAPADPLFSYLGNGQLNNAISSHHERMASAAAAAASSSNT